MPLESTQEVTRHWLRLQLPRPTDEALLERCLGWIEAPGHHFVTQDDPRYPPLLMQIADPPPALFVRGRAELLRAESLAIVGSRNATPVGRRDAFEFAAELSRRGICIASGLALGIDAAAHRGGLAGPGSSIAVLGTGPDVAYPAQNAALTEELAERGCVVTEFPVGAQPIPWNFPRRNRLISGLARGVLVVEAALKSGSLVTAYEASRQNREVFALPGSIHATLSKGCHALLRDGAKLVENVEHIVEEIAHWPRPQAPAGESRTVRHGEGSAFLESIGFAPVSIDAVVRLTGLDARESASRLAHLELEGRVARLAGGLYQRKP